jgi:alkaline phosphatase D
MHAARRNFLAQAARLASLTALAAACPRIAASNTANGYPFRLGVASGSPLPDGIVLWTRILPDPLNALLLPATPLAVRWELADDEAFTSIAAKGSAAALPALAHSVHVDVTGLRPGRWYWYRFMHGDAISPVGRTRTAPPPDAAAPALRLAVASCQHWEFGQYGAHRHIAAAAPDLVAFLGDYIYEWGPYDLAHPASARRSDESFTLAQYRARYAQYKTDPLLQAAHQAAPWIVTWDDHEVANDYGNDRDERLDPHFLQRRAAAYQAFYEHMPVRLPPLPAGPDRYAFLRMFQRYDWGRLARFHVLDDRQYRSYHACPKPGQGGSNSVTNSCLERLAPTRTLLGREQESWLGQGFANSPARWNIIAQQTLMAQNSQTPVQHPGDGRFWTDGWDGYPAARQRLLHDLTRHKTANPLVLSGDVHTFYATEIRPDFDRPVSTANPLVATEFCGTSVTSSSRPQARTAQYLAQNPHIKFGRSDKRGFMLLDITPTRSEVRFQALDDVQQTNTGVTTLAHFVVEDGKAGVVQA